MTDTIKMDSLFNDSQVQELHEALQDRFPLQVQINALYDAITGNDTLLREIIGYRNYLASQALMNGVSRIIVTANMTVTHANGQECVGENCTYFGCKNAKY
ncbi:MAG TPA: hypothetical protein VEC37_10910 [Bacillota bacterium]|nr:hypothetical protein [Bacillota bacterium]